MKIALPGLALAAAILTSFTATAGSWQQGVAAGGFDNVHIYTPDNRSPIGDGQALLVLLHGCVQPIDAYLTANLEEAAEEFGMVLAVPEAMHKAGYGCWSYWEGERTRTAGDYGKLVQLATGLAADRERDIDPAQVYIAGLSSGASFAHTTACLAPDVFAGVGASAGPSIGTSAAGALGPCENADVAARCLSYAGSHAPHFASQVASFAHGAQDSTVNSCYAGQNARGMARVYGVEKLRGTSTISEGSGTAEESRWDDGRITTLTLDGVDHAWSGGSRASGKYISDAGINYARYLGRFFAASNHRVAGHSQTQPDTN
ncbi:extracellular catalytic domain type 1 short-chain-length polyhydroxyalkanoate depolymerase [Microbulbifer yueqingensis]|uniref:Esterase, PHB depolymerase family n=1 Tax=Microbulbifer yueqingensis TaxID=658219 RepID=A0A1G8WU21_9GAMM|nr:PHB depolymerase family esterase [Microbulbifer yueqingensis]SDJ81848.1 esterase, PHB depolymerase family [Microbulbifer yueqingensis]